MSMMEKVQKHFALRTTEKKQNQKHRSKSESLETFGENFITRNRRQIKKRKSKVKELSFWREPKNEEKIGE